MKTDLLLEKQKAAQGFAEKWPDRGFGSYERDDGSTIAVIFWEQQDWNGGGPAKIYHAMLIHSGWTASELISFMTRFDAETSPSYTHYQTQPEKWPDKFEIHNTPQGKTGMES